MLYISGKEWPKEPRVGLIRVNDADLTNPANQLTSVAFVRPEATPDPWGAAYAFARCLEADPASGGEAAERAHALFSMYWKGLASRQLVVDHVVFRDAGLPSQTLWLGEILQKSERIAARGVAILRSMSGEAIAIHHPAVGFFPAANASAWPRGESQTETSLARDVESAFDRRCESFLKVTLREMLGKIDRTVKSEPAAWVSAATRLLNSLTGPLVEYAPNEKAVVAEIPLSIGAAKPHVQPVYGFRDALHRLLHIGEGAEKSGREVFRRLNGERLTDENGKAWTEILDSLQQEDVNLPLARVGSALVFVDGLAVNDDWEVSTRNGQLYFSRLHGAYSIVLEVDALVVSLDSMLVDGVLAPGGRPPAWPVRSEYLHLVSLCEITRIQKTTVEYRLQMVTGQDVVVTRRIEHPEAQPFVAIWPDFAAEQWREYRVFFGAASVRRPADWSLNFYAAQDEKPSIEWTAGTNTASLPITLLPHRPEFFEVVCAGEPLGIFRMPAPARQGSESGNGRIVCALDFGTSNSCMSWQDEQAAIQPALPKHAHDFSVPWQVVLGQGVLERIASACAGPSAASSQQLPSELISLGAGVSASLASLAGTAIPDMGVDTTTFINAGVVLSGFKWLDARSFPEATERAGIRNEIERAASAYLENLLTIFAAQQFANVSEIRVRASYPRAFDVEQAGSYEARLTKVCNSVSQKTGLRFLIDGFIDESMAAIVAGVGMGCEYNLAIDVGGGTTDYAVSPALEPGPDGVSLTHVDASSIRFAGNELLSALAARLAHVPELSNDAVGAQSDVARQLKLVQLIRSWRADLNRKDRPWAGLDVDPRLDRELEATISDGFLAITYYAAVMLAGRVIRDKKRANSSIDVRVHLGGNGWSLCGISSRNFAQWREQAGQAQFEADYASALLTECWDAISHSVGGLPQLQVEVNRALGKRAAASNMLSVKPRALRDLLNAESTETIGLNLAVSGTAVHPWESLPFHYGQRAAIACSGLWGAPPRLLERLFGSAGAFRVERVNKILLDPALYESVNAPRQNSRFTKAGQYLVHSPLKVLIEGMLVDQNR